MQNKSPEKIIDVFKRVSQSVYTTEQLSNQGISDFEIDYLHDMRGLLTASLKAVVDRWEVLDEYYIDDEIVNKFIEIKAVGLKDFHHELYETIRDILSEYFGLLTEATHPGWLPHQMNDRNNMAVGLDCFIEERAKLQSIVDKLPDFMKASWKIPVREDREYAARMMIDEIKYNIKNVEYKPEILRIIERKWKIFKQKLFRKRKL